MNITASPVSGLSILCVEDEPLPLKFLGQMLTMKYPDQKVTTAENGRSALELFRENPADIVLTDISMPVMDGISMAREIRIIKPGVCIIALTAHDDLQLPNEVAGLFDRFIQKPISSVDLYEAIDGCLTCFSQQTGNEN
ncbi:MAG: response regulator [Deltaproteobacteria bacterium]|nr:response regulator [Deltaproteobacteria bacterium]TLN01992.1 MAG: response regulator [bacterium]